MHQYFFWKTLISGIIIAINLQTGCMAKCTHPLFCQGPLFHSVQASRLFPDSKTFVDRPSLRPAEDILHDFENLLESSLSSLLQIQGGKEVNIVSQQEILFNFVKENFGPQGFDMRQYTPEDLVPFPEFSKNVSNRILSAWGGIVHRKWKDLSRVFVPPCPVCESSFIPVKHPFIIPGGRFLEAYYWDSYFAIKGLLVGGMERTTRGMIENFLDIVDKFGYFPNGLRIYYEGRSQPPMLTLMIKEYLDSSSSNNNQHISFLKRAMPILEKEYSWWMSERQVSVNGFNSLNRYNAPSHTQPRPESYIEDVETGQMAKKLNTITNILQVFSDLAASAESGWDFSSRFTMNPIQVSSCNNNITATSHANLARIKTSNVIPVDLNALMFMNEEIMASLFLRIGDSVKSNIFSSLAISRKEAILSLMWDSEAGQFYDFILSRNTTSGLFTPASFWPIWAGIHPPEKPTSSSSPSADSSRCKDLSQPFSELPSLLERFPGGIPTTHLVSGLQWDQPNAWPPLQYSTITALQRTSIEMSRLNCPTDHIESINLLAFQVAQTFINTTYCGWRFSGGFIPHLSLPKLLASQLHHEDVNGTLFEKYHVEHVGVSGHGGEYEPQEGFAWTNGIVIWALKEFGDRLTCPESC